MSPKMTDFHLIPSSADDGTLRGFPFWEIFRQAVTVSRCGRPSLPSCQTDALQACSGTMAAPAGSSFITDTSKAVRVRFCPFSTLMYCRL